MNTHTHTHTLSSLHNKEKKKMNTLKAIQTSFPPTKYAIHHNSKVSNRKSTTLCFSKSNDSESESSPPEGGDTNKQELLARIAMLQTMKVRLSDYLDEQSANLTQFAEEAKTEIDQIGEEGLKGLDEAEARIMQNLEGKMEAFDETAELNKEEIEQDEKTLAEFEEQIGKDLNEGLFFKSLGQKKTEGKVNAKEVTQKIIEVSTDSAGSVFRKNAYIALMALLTVGIFDALVTGSDWQRVAVLGAILIALAYQFTYEQQMSSEKTEKKDDQK